MFKRLMSISLRQVHLTRPAKHILVMLLPLYMCGCGERVLEPEREMAVARGGISAGAISDSGSHSIVGSVYHGISFWHLSDGERLFDWSHKPSADTTLVAADLSPDGAWALTADLNTLALWDTRSGEAPRYWRAPGDILAVQLTAQGEQALLGLSDHTAVLFDIRRGGIIHTFHHNNRVRSVSIDDKGSVAATGSEDYSASTWDLKENKNLARVRHNDEVQLVVLSPDGTHVLSMSQYDKAIIWRSHDGKVIGEIPLKAGRIKRGLRFTSARFSADNEFLLTGQTDQTVTLWRVKDLSSRTLWKVGKRRLWKPAGTSIIDVAFTTERGVFYAMASNGLIFQLALPES